MLRFLASASRDLTDCSIDTACEQALNGSKHNGTAQAVHRNGNRSNIGIGVQYIWPGARITGGGLAG